MASLAIPLLILRTTASLQLHEFVYNTWDMNRVFANAITILIPVRGRSSEFLVVAVAEFTVRDSDLAVALWAHHHFYEAARILELALSVCHSRSASSVSSSCEIIWCPRNWSFPANGILHISQKMIELAISALLPNADSCLIVVYVKAADIDFASLLRTCQIH